MIAVASGKGGVGKSSLTANLAAALSQLGHQVGILDADIYGHSIPHMLGIHQKPVLVDKLMIPPVKHDLKLMSIGFFLDDNAPVMWRGPMLHRALEQFLQDVHWGELDVLVVDMPPGHRRRLDLARPAAAARRGGRRHDAAAARAGGREPRGARWRRRPGMRLLGVIENMTSEVFGSGGGERLAAELGVPLLGSVPLDARMRESATRATPLVLSDPDSEPARAIAEIAARARRDARRRLHAHAAARLLSECPTRSSGWRALGFRDERRRGARRALPRRRGDAAEAATASADRLARDAGPSSTRTARPRAGRRASRATSAGTATARSATWC